MLRVVKNCVRRYDRSAREFDFFPGIEIAIEAREITAGNLQAQRVPVEKDVARGPEIDGDFIDLPGVYQSGVLGGSMVAHAQDTFGEVLREPVGRDIDQLRGEVGIYRRGFDEEISGDRAGDFQVMSQNAR
jgi:hypothetical protein